MDTRLSALLFVIPVATGRESSTAFGGRITEGDSSQKIHIGILSPATADRPHFKSLEQMLPAEVSVTNEGLSLVQNSYHDLEGKTDEIAARAADFVRRNQVHGLIVTGGFVTLFNPGLEAKVAEIVRIPVTSAVPSVTAALNALSVTKVMLVTPFTAEMNAHIEKHLTNLGFTVVPGPPYDKTRKPGAGVEISPNELFRESKQASSRIRPSRPSTFRAPPSIRCRLFKDSKITSASSWSPATPRCSGTSYRSSVHDFQSRATASCSRPGRRLLIDNRLFSA